MCTVEFNTMKSSSLTSLRCLTEGFDGRLNLIIFHRSAYAEFLAQLVDGC